jgi:hypothetical protein
LEDVPDRRWESGRIDPGKGKVNDLKRARR